MTALRRAILVGLVLSPFESAVAETKCSGDCTAHQVSICVRLDDDTCKCSCVAETQGAIVAALQGKLRDRDVDDGDIAAMKPRFQEVADEALRSKKYDKELRVPARNGIAPRDYPFTLVLIKEAAKKPAQK